MAFAPKKTSMPKNTKFPLKIQKSTQFYKL
jgi:hypothetical protein